MAITLTGSTSIASAPAKIEPIYRRISHFRQGCSLVSAGGRSAQFCPSLGLQCRWMNSSAFPAGTFPFWNTHVAVFLLIAFLKKLMVDFAFLCLEMVVFFE